MGNIITNWAQSQTVGSGGAKAVLLCLSDKAFDYERGKISMTQAQIAEVIEFDKRSVMRWLDMLEEKKIISRDRSKKSDGTNNPNSYQINCPAEIFVAKPSDRQSPCEADLVTDSHLDTQHSDRESPSYDDISPKIALLPPSIVTACHYAQGDSVSPSTVLNEEELNINKSLSPARAISLPEKIPKIPEASFDDEDIPQPESDDEQMFFDQVIEGLKTRMNTPASLPQAGFWNLAVEWAFQNKIPAVQALEVYDLLEKIRKKKKGKWRVTPKFWEESLPHLETLRLEVEELENGENGNGKPNNYPTRQEKFKPVDANERAGRTAVRTADEFDDKRFKNTKARI